MFGCAPSPGALAAAARKAAGFLAPALAAITRHLIAAEVAHFDETGFRAAGRLAWVHSASAGKFALFTVHAKRGKDGMKAAGVLPDFRGIAVHDAWAPYDTFGNVAGHALCGAHVLRELVAVTETGTGPDRTWAQQAIDALVTLNEAAEAARAAGRDAIDPETRAKHEDWHRKAAEAGIALSAARQGKLQQKRHALATRMKDREDDYLRFARDLRVPFSNDLASYCTSCGGWRARGLLGVQVVVVLVVSVWLVGLTFCRGTRGRPDVRWGLRRPERWWSPRRLTAFSVSAGAGRAWPGW